MSMQTKLWSRRQFGLLSLLSLFMAATAALAADDKPAVERDIGGDHFVFGGSVRIDKPVSGDLVAAGGNVDIDAPVAGDAVVAGGNVRLNSTVGQDVYIGGGRIVIDGSVGHNLRVGGGQIDIGPKASVAGNVSIGGGQLTLRGAVKGSMQVGGGRVLIDGPVQGDVVSTAGQLELGPNARIGGSLRYRSRDDLQRDPAAQVTGAVERLALPGVGRGASAPMGHDDDDRGRHMGYGGYGIGGGWLLWTLGLVALGVLLVLALPETSRRVALSWRQRFGWSLLLGFITLVCVPVATLILLVTIVGIPLALLLLLLYLALLLVAYVSSGVALGEWLLGRFKPAATQQKGWRLASAALAVLALALLSSVPYLGGVVSFAAVLVGIGAIALQLAPASRTAAA
jgi:cytoskeletal protein CcmA (bactofilin family)